MVMQVTQIKRRPYGWDLCLLGHIVLLVGAGTGLERTKMKSANFTAFLVSECTVTHCFATSATCHHWRDQLCNELTRYSIDIIYRLKYMTEIHEVERLFNLEILFSHPVMYYATLRLYWSTVFIIFSVGKFYFKSMNST